VVAIGHLQEVVAHRLQERRHAQASLAGSREATLSEVAVCRLHGCAGVVARILIVGMRVLAVQREQEQTVLERQGRQQLVGCLLLELELLSEPLFPSRSYRPFVLPRQDEVVLQTLVARSSRFVSP